MKCENCNRPKSKSGKRFCSQKCANVPRNWETRCCLFSECSETFEVVLSSKKKYCSHSCAAKVNNRGVRRHGNEPKVSKPKIQQWLDGEWDGTVKSGLSSVVREYLIAAAGNKCQDGRSGCNGWEGYNPKSGNSCLTVDHVDGNSMNNKPENLRVMCPNCHSMTETYGSLNRGSGRSFRYNNS